MLTSKAVRHHDWLERAFCYALIAAGIAILAVTLADWLGYIHLSQI